MKKLFKLHKKSSFIYSGILTVTILLLSLHYFGCSTADTISNVQRLKFKLGSIDNFKLSGIPINKKSSLTDFSLLDALKLTNAFAEGKLPADFRINIIAKNPNTPGGSENTTSAVTSMEWRLFIDNKETLNGVIDKKITVPGIGKEALIPIDISIDLMEFFRNLGYDRIINFALALGGVNGSTSNVMIKAVPSMKVFGFFFSGDEVTIIDKQFN